MDFNKKYLGVPLAVIILIIGIGIATAGTLVVVQKKIIQWNATIEKTTSSDNYEFTIYETRDCNHEITTVDFGSAKPGTTLHTRFYIKNTGDSYIPELDMSIPKIDTIGWSSSGWSDIKGSAPPQPLEVGEIASASLHITIGSDAQPGDYSGEIKIVAKASKD